MNVNTKHWWNNTVRETSKYSAKNRSHNHFVQHKTHIREFLSLSSWSRISTIYLERVQSLDNLTVRSADISHFQFSSVLVHSNSEPTALCKVIWEWWCWCWSWWWWSYYNNFTLCMPSRQRGGVETQISPFFLSTGDRDGWLSQRLDRSTPPNLLRVKDLFRITQEAGWALEPLWTGFPPLGFELRTYQAEANCYTDYPIQVHHHQHNCSSSNNNNNNNNKQEAQSCILLKCNSY